MSNTTEGVQVNLNREFRIFDALPEWVREILRNCNDDVHVEPVARFFVKMNERGLSQQYMSYEIRKLVSAAARCN